MSIVFDFNNIGKQYKTRFGTWIPETIEKSETPSKTSRCNQTYWGKTCAVACMKRECGEQLFLCDDFGGHPVSKG